MAFRTNKMPVLQEKSASGAVASFNTALAMPLVECKTEFMCTQEAGTPSPSNPLAITGVDSVAIQKSGQNIMQESFEVGSISSETGLPTVADDRIRSVNYSPCLPNTRYYFVIPNKNLRIFYYDDSYGYINFEGWYDSSRIIRTPVNCHYIKVIGSGAYGTTYNNDISINADRTDTTYHPYISNTVTIIDLDGTRYGGYVDVVRKKGYGTWNYLYINDASDAEIFAYNNMNGIRFPNRCPRSNRQSGISNMSNKVGRDFSSGALWCGVLTNDSSLYWVGILDILNMTLDQFKLWIVDHPLEVAYQIQLETDYTVIDLDIPTLSTIIGNNSFASDSGSIDLTYKDLDIAKRGNFREVFKLPS